MMWLQGKDVRKAVWLVFTEVDRSDVKERNVNFQEMHLPDMQ